MNFNDLLTLAQTTDTAWTAPGVPRTDEPRLFGGVLIAQAILAASAGAPACHALHAFFIGVGEKEQPFDITVARTRDGRSFATRHVKITQAGRLLLAGHSSHHNGDPGPEHQMQMPDLPPPAPEGASERMFRGFRSEHVWTSGATIFTLSSGFGPPLNLLHGHPETHVTWHMVASSLARTRTVIVPNLRG